MYIQINSLEKDLLKEIMNVGVSKAADAFAQVTHSESPIMLTIPEVKIISPEELKQELKVYSNIKMAVKNRLEGDLAGVAMVLFYKEQMDWIIRHCIINSKHHLEDCEPLRESLLLEISNILTGAIVTQLSNILGLQIVGMAPESIPVAEIEAVENVLCEVLPCQPIVLSIRTHFLDHQIMIEFPLLIVLEVGGLSKVLNVIRQKGIYSNELLRKK